MADKKIEKALYGPSLMEVALGAVLGLLVGIMVACVYLVFKPVQTVKEMPKEPSRSVVYFLPGSETSSKSKNWQAKQKQYVAGTAGTILLVEDELNAWAGTISVAAAPAPAKPGAAAPKADAGKPAPEGVFIPGKPNFRIVDGKLQIGLKCTLNWYGLMAEVTAQTTGAFEKSGDGFVFVPDKVYLGSCPVHLLPLLARPLVSYLVSREKIPDEIRGAWAKLDGVTIEGAALKLVAQ